VIFSGASDSPNGTHPKCDSTDFGGTNTLTFSGGTATCSMTLYRAHTVGVSATIGSLSSSHTVVVSPGALQSLGVDAPDKAYIGIPFTMGIAAKDAYGNGTSGLPGDAAISVSRGNISPASIPMSAFSEHSGPDGQVYAYERDIAVTNSNASALSGYQVRLNLDTSSASGIGAQLQGDCDDLRFATFANANIPYWLETGGTAGTGCGTTNTTVWLRMDLPASSTQNIYMYYGNPNVASASDGNAVFDLFDDFSGGSLNTDKWDASGTGTTTLSGGIMTTRQSASSNYFIKSKSTFGTNVAVRARLKSAHMNSSLAEYLRLTTDEASRGLTAVYSNTNTSYNDYYANNGSSTTIGMVGWAVNTYAVQDMIRNSITNAIFRINDGNQATISSAIYTGSDCKVQFLTYGNGASMSADWVLVRKYAATEPTPSLQSSGSSPYLGIYSGSFTLSNIDHAGDLTITASSSGLSGNDHTSVDFLSHLRVEDVSGQSSSQMAAGSTQAITIKAMGDSGSVFENYTGTKSITLSDAGSIGSNHPTCTDNTGAAIQLGQAMNVNFTGGIASCNLTLYKSEQEVITATDQTYSALDANALTIDVTSTATAFDISFPAAVLAGVPFQVSLFAHDAYGNGATSYSGTHQITFSGASEVGGHNPSCDGTDFGTGTSLNFTNGTASCTMILYKAEVINVTAGDGSFISSQGVTVSAGSFDHFDLNVPDHITSGFPFKLSLAARDASGNPTLAVTGDTTLSVNHGTLNGSTIPDSTFHAYAGPDGNSYSGERDILVTNTTAGELPNHQVKLIFDTRPFIAAGMQSDCSDLRLAETAGTAVTYWVESGCNTASTVVWLKTSLAAGAHKNIYMFYGNASAGSAGNASAFDPASADTLASASLLTSGSDGAHVFNLTLSGIVQEIPVNLTVTHEGIAPLIRTLTVSGTDFMDHLSLSLPSASFAADETPTLTVAAIGTSGNTYLTYEGQKTLNFSGADAIGDYKPTCAGTDFTNPVTLNFHEGVATCPLRLYKAGSFSLTATDGQFNADATPLNVAVSPGALHSFDITAPDTAVTAAPFSVTLIAHDVYSNVITVPAAPVTLTVDHGMSSPASIDPSAFSTGSYNGSITVSQVYADQDVRLTFSSGSGTSSETVSFIGIDELDHLSLDAHDVIAGQAQNASITAVGKSGQVFKGYAGGKTIRFGGAGDIGTYRPTCASVPFGDDMSLTFVDGVASCSLSLYKKETAAVTMTDTVIGLSATRSVTVSPEAFTVIGLSVPPSGTVSKQSFSMTVTSLDRYGNVVTDIRGGVSLAVDQGAIGRTGNWEADLYGGGTYTGYYIISRIYSDADVNISATAGAASGSTRIHVAGVNVMNHFKVTGSTDHQFAGDAQQVYITALNDAGTMEGSYTGIHKLVFSGAGVVGGNVPNCDGVAFGKDISLSFDHGVATCIMQLYDKGDHAITVSDHTYETGGGSDRMSVRVDPLPPSSLTISGATSVISTYPFNLNLTAKDPYGNVSAGIPGDIAVTTDKGTITPSAIPAASFGGSYYGQYTLSGIPFNDEANLTFTSGGITANWHMNVTGVDEMGYLKVEGPASQVAGESQAVTITAYTIGGQVYTDYDGTKNVRMSHEVENLGLVPTCTDNTGAAIPLGQWENLDFAQGVATCDLTLYRAGSDIIYAYDGHYSSGKYHSFGARIQPAALASFRVGAPPTAVSTDRFGFTITGLDRFNNAAPNPDQDVTLVVSAGELDVTTVPASSFTNATYTGQLTISGITDATTSVTLSAQGGSIYGEDTLNVYAHDVMDHLALGAEYAEGGYYAGGVYDLYIQMMGVSGHTFGDYTGSHQVVLGGAGTIGSYIPTCDGVVFGQPLTMEFERGVAKCAVRIYKAGISNLTAEVDDRAFSNAGYEYAFTVKPRSVASFTFDVPASVTSGTSFDATLTAKDTYGNVTTSVPEDVVLTSAHGSFVPGIVAKDQLATDGTFSFPSTVGGVLTDAPDNTLSLTSGRITQQFPLPVIGVDMLDHFLLESSASQVAGSVQTIIVTAIGLSGNVLTGYSGNKNILFEGASSTGTYFPSITDAGGTTGLFGNSLSVSFTAGKATFSMKLYKAEQAAVIVRSGSNLSNTLNVTVAPAPLYSFSGEVPTVATNGIPFLLSLTAKDQYGNTVTEVSNDAGLIPDQGSIDPVSVGASEFSSNGTCTRTVTISGITDDTTVNLLIENGGVPQNATLVVTGVDHVDHLAVTADTASAVAGMAKRAYVSLLQADGSVYSVFSGDREVTLGGPEAFGSFLPFYTGKDRTPIRFGQKTILTFTNGVATTDLMLYESGAQEIAADDSIHSGNASLILSVSSAVPDSLTLEAASSAANGTPLPLTISGMDHYGNPATSFPEDVSLTVSSGTLDISSVPSAQFSADGTASLAITFTGSSGDVILTARSGAVIATQTITFQAPASSGAVFIPPMKPDASKIGLRMSDGRLVFVGELGKVAQFAVSASANFKGTDWHALRDAQSVLGRYLDALKLCLKFRSASGGVSDILVYEKPQFALVPDEGEIVRTAASPDVYVLKLVNGKKFKRLLLSPAVFNSYHHLRWENLKIIPATQLEEYITSDLVQVRGDGFIYELFSDGDRGRRMVWDPARPFDPDSVYEINAIDRDSYAAG
jgi:S-adenosylmethionine hydrolase